MSSYALLIGNGINNISSGPSWSELLEELTQHLAVEVEFTHDKPFPLAYEEIYFKAVKSNQRKESDIKKFIANQADKITFSEVHQALNSLSASHIMTTNYDLSLELAMGASKKSVTNSGLVKEAKYSLFRKHTIEDKNFWHIHGSQTSHNSITLGYEHYGGYLQYMRNYVTMGTKGIYKNVDFKSLLQRIKKDDVSLDSWVDLFFTQDIHIIGLTLDFVETDLWWLLTYREKAKFEHKLSIANNIYYYIPARYVNASKTKLEMLHCVGVEVIELSETGPDYYHRIVDYINDLY